MVQFLVMSLDVIDEKQWREIISPSKQHNPVDALKTISNIDKIEEWAQDTYNCSIFND